MALVIKKINILFYLYEKVFESSAPPSSIRSVQSEADEVRGPRAGPSPGACPGDGRAGQAAHLQQICVQHQSGGEEGHSG